MLTADPPPRSANSVGRPKINEEQTPARLPAGTLARIDAALQDREKRSDFIRKAIEAELDRRESAQGSPPPAERSGC